MNSEFLKNVIILDKIEEFIEFDIKRVGLSLIKKDDKIIIYSDVFRSVPLYVYTKKDKTIVLFQNYKKFISSIENKLTIDLVSFNESLLYGTPLWTRTLYNEVKQLPAASRLIIDQNTGEYLIERYWNFSIIEDLSITSIQQAADMLHERLNKIYNKLNTSLIYYIGISGGLDSRLSLSYLSKFIHKNKINAFTFGFNSNILEYKYSRSVATALNIDKVEFHKLIPSIYREALNYMPQKSFGHISINHCHIDSYFRSKKKSNCVQISNYFSDAIFGYASKLPKKKHDYRKNNYIDKLNSNKFLNPQIKDAIESDIFMICKDYDENSNFSSIDEYLYLTERHAKFHFNLARVQSENISTILPFVDFDLLKFMISVPLRFREQKIILDELFNRHFKKVKKEEIPQISSRFSYNFASAKEWLQFRLLNTFNGILRYLTNGKIQLFNKFQTEEHERLIYGYFRHDLDLAIEKFHTLNLLTKEQCKYYKKLPLRAKGFDSRFTLISLSSII
jgi:hypothetical protein